MLRALSIPALLLRLLCAGAMVLGGFARSLPADANGGMVGELALYTLPDGSLPPLCLPGTTDAGTTDAGTTDDGPAGKKMAPHLCDLCLLSASAFLSGPEQVAFPAIPPARQIATVQEQRPEAFYRQFFPPQAPPIGPPAAAIA